MPEDVPLTIVLGLVLVFSVVAVGLFVVDAGSTAPEPVEFDDTVQVGLTLEDEYLFDDVDLPRVQAFYSQYEYVVGYYGVETFVESQNRAGHEQQFGYPMAVYVSDYSDTGLELNEEGNPVTDRSPSWTDAESAWFVIDSDARAQTGDTVLPFSSRADADAFADRHGGDVRDWEEVLEGSFEREDADVARDRVEDHHRLADERVAASEPLLERDSSVTVEDTNASVQAAIDRAPPNSTVVLSEGTYQETLEVDESITLAGEGDVTLEGDGNGTVVTVTAADVAIDGVEITGVGNVSSGGEELPIDIDQEEWDATFTEYYAGTDAGIGAYTADGLLVRDVSIDTPASGIIAYESEDAVVQNVTVEGPADPTEGLAGYLMFRSPSVVEDSATIGATNGIYTFRSPKSVVRSNTVEGNRLGIHTMHTDDSLFAENEIRNQDTGLYVMTGPERNAVIDNTVRDADVGYSIGGSDSYVAGNLATDTDLGLRIESSSSIYQQNVLAGNEIGVDVTGLLPTNRVVSNDFVENDRHATATSGPLRIWTDDGVGNYWQGGAAVGDGEVADRSYTPTDDVDRQLHRTDGTETLARAPALSLRTSLEGTVPGMRTGSIVDQAPACTPNDPERLEEIGWEARGWTC